MRLLFSIFFSLVSITIGLGQSSPTMPSIMIGTVIVEDNNSAARMLNSKTVALLKKNYHVVKNTALQLDLKAIPGKAYTINGMDTYTVSDVEMNYTISLAGRNSQSKTISVKCKGTNELDLQRKIGTTILRNKEIRQEVIAFIEEYIAANLNTCPAVTALIDQQLNSNQPASAYASLAYYDMTEGCLDLAKVKENEILEAIGRKSCKSLLAEAEILANGATIRELTRATNKLLMIGPDAPCQEEVIRIAEVVAKNASAIGTKSSNDINIRLDQRHTQTRAEWQAYYRNQYYLGN